MGAVLTTQLGGKFLGAFTAKSSRSWFNQRALAKLLGGLLSDRMSQERCHRVPWRNVPSLVLWYTLGCFFVLLFFWWEFPEPGSSKFTRWLTEST